MNRIHIANIKRLEYIKLGAKRKRLIIETAKGLNISPQALIEYFASMDKKFLQEEREHQ